MTRLYLRAFEPEDYKLINEWRIDEDIYKLLGGNHNFVSSVREKQWVDQKMVDDNNNIYLAICLKEEKRMIGYTCIKNIDLRNLKAELGYIIGDKTKWGKGFATEAEKITLKYLFHQYPIHKCYAYCLQEHIVSIKLLKSLGFKQDGILRDEVYKDGEFKSFLVFSILREEFEEALKGYGL